jgi:hypothetical protein
MSNLIGEQVSSQQQLNILGNFEANGWPLLIHGSIGHAALMDIDLPSETRFNGTTRDIDVFVANATKTNLEGLAEDIGVSAPNPLDAGLCNLLVRDGEDVYANKDGVTVELEDGGVFDEVITYEARGTDGIQVRSFSPVGLLAVHRLEPSIIRPGHLKVDWQLVNWFKKNDVQIPTKLQASIDEFHSAYKEAYPLGTFYKQLSDIYVTVTPESIRQKFRKQTHRFMRDHAGRVTPFAD